MASVRADAERKRDDRDQCEPGFLEQDSYTVADVLKHGTSVLMTLDFRVCHDFRVTKHVAAMPNHRHFLPYR